MKARGVFKKFAALAIAGTMVVGSAMVTFADSGSADELVNAKGYKPGVVYTGNEDKFNDKGEALPGYHWDSKELTSRVEAYDELICTKDEHTHSSETADDCQGYVLTCNKEEHTHSQVGGACYTLTCNLKEHSHSVWGCGIDHWRCVYRYEHQHGDDCYAFTCTKEEHTHTSVTGICYTQKTCDIEEHIHTQECYEHHDAVQATYKFQMKADENKDNGNKKISISIHVDCENGLPANGVTVGITAHDDDFGIIAKEPTLVRNGTTDLDGNITFKISATYDSITDISVNGVSVGGYAKEIGRWINNSVNLSYSVNHDYKEVPNSAEDTRIVDGAVKVGKYADQKCSFCEDKQEGEAHKCETLKGFLLTSRDVELKTDGSSMDSNYFKAIGSLENGIVIKTDADGKEYGELVDGATDLLLASSVNTIKNLLQDGEAITNVEFGRLQHEKDGWHADYVIKKASGGDGDQGGNTGDQGGNTGDQGGNTGDQGGNTGDQGGNTGDQGENTGDQGENTGDQGENTGDQGGNTGDQSDNTNPSSNNNNQNNDGGNTSTTNSNSTNAVANNNVPTANNAANNAPAVGNNNAGNTPIVLANNDAAANNNAGANDNNVVIEDQETPLAANDQNADDVNNAADQNTVTIADEDTPKAAAEDSCYIHWMVLILTLLAGGYSLVRAFVRIRKESEETEIEF